MPPETHWQDGSLALRADDVDLSRDCRLVERFQSGDAAAFDDLYRRYYARLVRFCLRRVGDPHEAEEIAQEAFVRAYRALPRLAGERRFYPWVTVIASRLCVDSHRRQARTEVADVIDLGSVEANLDDIFAAVDRQYLADAMARLAPRHREVLHLREGEGWNAARIADHYAVSVGTVEALLHRARRSLRREFLALTENGGLLAGVPLIGALGRRFAAARHRVSAWAGGVGELATPLAVKAASVAVAMGTTALASGAVASGGPAIAARAAPVVSVAAAPALATASVPVVAPAPSAGGPASLAPSPRPHALTATGGSFGRAAQGRQAASDAPVRAEQAGTGASADPSAIAEQLDAAVQPILKGLP
jgi:RNA polymerase sigma-70 factor (ECF subfamily)